METWFAAFQCDCGRASIEHREQKPAFKLGIDVKPGHIYESAEFVARPDGDKSDRVSWHLDTLFGQKERKLPRRNAEILTGIQPCLRLVGGTFWLAGRAEEYFRSDPERVIRSANSLLVEVGDQLREPLIERSCTPEHQTLPCFSLFKQTPGRCRFHFGNPRSVSGLDIDLPYRSFHDEGVEDGGIAARQCGPKRKVL